MSADRTSSVEGRLALPAILLSLCLLTLLVTLFGLFRTSSITQTRVNDLQISWKTLSDKPLEVKEIVETDRHMQSIVKPVPAIESAARWSLAMGGLSLVFLAWHLISLRSRHRGLNIAEHQQVINDQAAIAKLLDEMAPLASGELGVRATASDGDAGVLADAFNHSVSELQRLAEVQLSASRALGESASQSREGAIAIEQHCKQQIGHIHQSSNFLLGMSSSTGALSANTVDTSVAARAMLHSVDSVAAILKQKSEQIDRMRGDSDLSIMLMNATKQHACSIEDAFAILSELAQRADLLAVNTTIRVSSASSDVAPEDIGMLTDEVARLSNAIRRAVDDLGSSTRSMTVGASDAIACLQRLNSSCDDQAAQTRAVRDSMVEIRTHSKAVNAHASQMAEQAVSHAGTVKELSDIMHLMNRITQHMGKDAQTNAVTMEGLKKIANELRQSTSDFKLPGPHHASPVEYRPVNNVASRAAERATING